MAVLEAALLALLGAWCLALARLARTWRNMAPVALEAPRRKRRLAA